MPIWRRIEFFCGVFREAETLLPCNIPDTVRFYGMEHEGRLTFMLMDYVEGTTLRGQIFDSKAPYTYQAVLYYSSVCSALHYAHNQGVEHCDIKPANIMVKLEWTCWLQILESHVYWKMLRRQRLLWQEHLHTCLPASARAAAYPANRYLRFRYCYLRIVDGWNDHL